MNGDHGPRPRVAAAEPATDPVPGFARTLADIAVTWQHQPDTESTLHAIAESAVALIPGTRWDGVLLVRAQRLESRVPSDTVVADLDDLQIRLDDGPGVSALRRHDLVYVHDVTVDARWPRFARVAATHRVGSLVALPLSVRPATLGALTLYADHPEAFTPTAIVAAQLLCQHAAVALRNATTVEQLQEAIASRDVIGQAKGIVMHRDDLTGDRAFQLLVETSQTANVKLVDVARWLVENHERPATPRQ